MSVSPCVGDRALVVWVLVVMLGADWFLWLRGVVYTGQKKNSPTAPPFSEDNVADVFGPLASVGHVSDCLISFAAAFVCVAAVFSPHLGGDQDGMTG